MKRKRSSNSNSNEELKDHTINRKLKAQGKRERKGEITGVFANEARHDWKESEKIRSFFKKSFGVWQEVKTDEMRWERVGVRVYKREGSGGKGKIKTVWAGGRFETVGFFFSSPSNGVLPWDLFLTLFSLLVAGFLFLSFTILPSNEYWYMPLFRLVHLTFFLFHHRTSHRLLFYLPKFDSIFLFIYACIRYENILTLDYFIFKINKFSILKVKYELITIMKKNLNLWLKNKVIIIVWRKKI